VKDVTCVPVVTPILDSTLADSNSVYSRPVTVPTLSVARAQPVMGLVYSGGARALKIDEPLQNAVTAMRRERDFLGTVWERSNEA